MWLTGSTHPLRILTRIRPLFSPYRSHRPPTPRWTYSTASTYSTAATMTVDTTTRLNALRELMRKPENDVNAYVVPSEDQHASEYIAECDERRAHISGFTGSAGTAIVTLDGAFLFTDGRYFLQAEKQLDSNWTLMKQGLPDVPTWQEFLSKNLDNHSRIGMDPTLITAADAESLQTSLRPKESHLVSLTENLVDHVWENRPARPANEIVPLDIKYSGESHLSKITRIQDDLKKKNTKAIVITMLDEIAWLFNLRGSDIAYNPVFFAYAVVSQSSGATLFVKSEQLTDGVRSHLGEGVKVREYDEFFGCLSGLGVELELSKDAQVLIGDKTSLAIAEAIGHDSVVIVRSPVADFKSIKNTTEIEGFRQSHIRDGVALVRYFAWLEETLQDGNKKELTEYQVAEKLEEYRSEGDLYRGLSFDTISATGANGAIIHYSPDPKDSAIVKKEQMYLCDSGAQYLDGTTDVTRTWHFGTPTPEEKRAFTRVLQGHIAIDSAVFPNGTTGYVIDSWARRPLWEDGLDYRHGTGHGVGHFLNVHEGPQGIGVRIAYNNTPLKAGMTVSNEPGYYADNQFGIRIESVVIVKPVQTRNNFGGKGCLGFERVTMCPIQTKLIDLSLLSPHERRWVDEYHAEVLAKVGPLLEQIGRSGDGSAGEKDGDRERERERDRERAVRWLERETAPLGG